MCFIRFIFQYWPINYNSRFDFIHCYISLSSQVFIPSVKVPLVFPTISIKTIPFIFTMLILYSTICTIVFTVILHCFFGRISHASPLLFVMTLSTPVSYTFIHFISNLFFYFYFISLFLFFFICCLHVLYIRYTLYAHANFQSIHDI